MKMQICCLTVGIAYLLSSALAAVPPSSSDDRLAGAENLRHTAVSPAHFGVEWDDVATTETGYRIWWREAGGEWHLAGTTGPDVTHSDDGGMKSSTNYLFYGGGSRLDTSDGKDLRLIRLHADFFTSRLPGSVGGRESLPITRVIEGYALGSQVLRPCTDLFIRTFRSSRRVSRTVACLRCMARSFGNANRHTTTA